MTDQAVDPAVPFRELFPFYEQDAHYFFGREADTRVLVANLLASRVTVVFGPSGAGKSSLLRAGVLAQLQKTADARRARGRTPEVAAAILARWHEDPKADLRQAILEGFERSGAAARPDLSSPELREVIGRCAEALDEERGQVLLVLDQFEEYFLYHPAELAQGSFAAELAKLIADPELPVSVLISLREDAIGKLDAFKGGIPGLFRNLVRVEPLEREAAGDAIHKTVQTFNALHKPVPAIEVEPDLVREVLDQVQLGQVRVGDAAGLSPSAAAGVKRVESSFLQLVMARVWRRELEKKSNRLTARTLSKDLGGAERIVRDHVETRIARLRRKQQDGAAEVLGYLVTSGGGEDLVHGRGARRANRASGEGGAADPGRAGGAGHPHPPQGEGELRAVPRRARGGGARMETNPSRRASIEEVDVDRRRCRGGVTLPRCPGGLPPIDQGRPRARAQGELLPRAHRERGEGPGGGSTAQPPAHQEGGQRSENGPSPSGR